MRRMNTQIAIRIIGPALTVSRAAGTKVLSYRAALSPSLVMACHAAVADGIFLSMCADLPDYKDTLNLPQTDFPMRAGLPTARGPNVLYWESRRLSAAAR